MLRWKRPSQKSSNPAVFFLRWVVWGGTSLLGLVVLAVLLLHWPPFQKQLVREIIERLERDHAVRVQMGAFRWNPLSELVLDNFQVEANGKEILRTTRAELRYGLSLSWPYLHPREIVLMEPLLRLARNPGGSWRLPLETDDASGDKLSASGKDDIPWARLPLPQVRIFSGTLIGEENGEPVLVLKDVQGNLSCKINPETDGPRIVIDLGSWRGQAETPYWGELQLEGEGEVAGGRLMISRLTFRASEGVSLAAEGEWSLAPPFDGRSSVDIERLSLHLLPPVRDGFPALKELTGRMTLRREGERWSVEHDLRSNLGHAKGDLSFDDAEPDSPRWALSTHFDGLSIPWPEPVPENHLAGMLNLSGEGQGLKSMKARVDMVLEPSRWAGTHVERATFSGEYEGGRVTLKGSDIASSLGDTGFSVQADLAGLWDEKHTGDMAVEMDLNRGQLGKFLAGSKDTVAGTVRFRAAYSPGDFRRAERWQADGEARINIPQFLTLQASGGVRDQKVDVGYELEVSDVARISTFWEPWSGQGRVSSHGKFQGRWPDVAWEGDLQSPRLQVGDVRGEQVAVTGKGRIPGRAASRTVTLKARNVSLGQQRVGQIQLDLEQTDETVKFQFRGDEVLKEGSVRLAGRLENLWAWPRRFVLTQGQLQWRDLPATADARVELDEGRIRVQAFNLQQGKGRIGLTGEVAGESHADLNLQMESLPVGVWLAALGLKEPAVGGTLSGLVQLHGRPDRPEGTISLQLVNGSIAAEMGEEPAGRKPGGSGKDKGKDKKAAEASGVLKETIERLQIKGTYSNNWLVLQGDAATASVRSPMPFTARCPLRLSLKPFVLEPSASESLESSLKVVGLQAERLLPLLEDLDRLGGELDGDIRAGGSLAAPALEGRGVWRNGHLRVEAWKHPFENIQADWEADSHTIYVRRGEMTLDGGRVSITGKAGYPHFKELDFEAQASDVGVSGLYGIKGKASGQVRIVQAGKDVHLTGTVRLSKAVMNLGGLQDRLAQSIELVDGSARGQVVEIKGDEKTQANYYNLMRMEIGVELPPAGTWVKGRGLEAEITGAIRIEKAPYASIKLAGAFQTLRGTYAFQGNTLKIVEGEIVFTPSPEPDPQLRIVCQKEFRDVTVQVQVTGPLSRPKLVLSSVPAMNQVDVLSYLLFDHPAGELSSAQSSQLQDRAASWLGSQASLALKQILGNTPFAPDTLRYRTSTDRSDASKDVGVIEIGKYITPDLYVTYERGVRGDDGNRVQVEYRLNRHLSIQTEVGQAENSGVDVFWRHDFGD